MGAAEIFARPPISPLIELGAYEELWATSKATFKSMAALFAGSANDLPSDFVDVEIAQARGQQVLKIFESKGLKDAGIAVFGTLSYPQSLRAARHPVQLLYYRGNLDLLSLPLRVAVVGTREPSEDGLKRTRKLVNSLVADRAVVVSGLARGIDTAAHRAAIDAGGITVGVIGTAISEVFPSENTSLQEQIAREFLLVSQVPVLRYRNQTAGGNRFFFPERNVTMSALTDATVIVEAGETSGTLIQARAAIEQKRKLFVLDSCFRKGLAWPERLAAQGAIRVSDYSEIRDHLELPPS